MHFTARHIEGEAIIPPMRWEKGGIKGVKF
jgi:hypothetical protein